MKSRADVLPHRFVITVITVITVIRSSLPNGLLVQQQSVTFLPSPVLAAFSSVILQGSGESVLLFGPRLSRFS